MSRAKRGFKARRRRNKVFKRAKGFHFDRGAKWRHTVQTVIRALHYAYFGRKELKRNMRKLWIIRINAACRTFDLSYSKFINLLKTKGVELNRKMLAELAATDLDGFKAVVDSVK
jgi:large subunit ribosomal protein L20